MRPLKKIINLANLRHNLQFLQQKVGNAELIAVVKADAYGHGVKNLLPALENVSQFAVASIDEALQLRELGIKKPVILLEGIFTPEEAVISLAADFIPCIHNIEQSHWLMGLTGLKAWLKIDSGMHRLGFSPEKTDWLEITKRLPNIDWQGILSHFACADDPDEEKTHRQMRLLNQLSLPSHWKRCFANSAAILQYPDTHADFVRAGLALYGMSPFVGRIREDLRPVMTLQTEVLAVRYLQKGEFAGYSEGFSTPKDGNLATIALGYGDGFPRNINSGAVFLALNGKKYPIVGRVAMDMTLLWLGDDQAQVGDEVIVFGEKNLPEYVAIQADTIPYTLTTMLTARPRTEIIQ